MKVIFFTGKGGVGKSTNSSLLALKTARQGKRVVLNSLDPAHNLHDIFQKEMGKKPLQFEENLVILETDLTQKVQNYLKQTEEEYKSVYKYQQAFNIESYFKALRYAPGLEEYAVLLSIEETMAQYSHFDYIIFDTPPTALTLKFLSLPQVSMIWLSELKKLREGILHKKGIMSKIKTGKKESLRETDAILLKINELIERYGKLTDILKNKEQTSVVIVMNNDSLSLAESKDIWQRIRELKMSVPLIVMNRCSRADMDLVKRKGKFHGANIVCLPLHSNEITGEETLTSIDLPYGVEDIFKHS